MNHAAPLKSPQELRAEKAFKDTRIPLCLVTARGCTVQNSPSSSRQAGPRSTPAAGCSVLHVFKASCTYGHAYTSRWQRAPAADTETQCLPSQSSSQPNPRLSLTLAAAGPTSYKAWVWINKLISPKICSPLWLPGDVQNSVLPVKLVPFCQGTKQNTQSRPVLRKAVQQTQLLTILPAKSSAFPQLVARKLWEMPTSRSQSKHSPITSANKEASLALQMISASQGRQFRNSSRPKYRGPRCLAAVRYCCCYCSRHHLYTA